jgi:hypothetical protein
MVRGSGTVLSMRRQPFRLTAMTVPLDVSTLLGVETFVNPLLVAAVKGLVGVNLVRSAPANATIHYCWRR